MKLFGLTISRRAAGAVDINTIIRRLEAVHETASGISVTPDNCEQSPTVKAIVTAVTRRFAAMPVHVFQKTRSKGRDAKELLANHPVERLLARPNSWQTRVNYWMDATSWLLRYGNFYCYKARGQTGPILRLIPLHPGATEIKQDADDVTLVSYQHREANGRMQTYPADEIHHVRTTARDGLKGDSWITDVRETIALEIAAERFGASFFGNGAMPGITLEYQEGTQGHKSDEERTRFIEDFQERFSGRRGRFRAMLLPVGIKFGEPIPVENEKAQFNQLRMLQRTIIAGAAGVPPHLVGDLSKGTYNNVEAQGGEFTTNVIVPIASVFEAAMERDLLTATDRASGVIIRFNPDAILRGDFKARQDGLAIQRQNGVINANEWREREGMNPRDDDGGEAYYETGPSGQTSSSSQQQTSEPAPGSDGNAT